MAGPYQGGAGCYSTDSTKSFPIEGFNFRDYVKVGCRGQSVRVAALPTAVRAGQRGGCMHVDSRFALAGFLPRCLPKHCASAAQTQTDTTAAPAGSASPTACPSAHLHPRNVHGPLQGQFVKQAFVQSKSRMRRWAEVKSTFTGVLGTCEFDGEL